MNTKKITVIFLFFIVIFACEDQISSHCDMGEIENSDTMSAQFSAIQTTILDARCITCHSGSAPSAGLDLSSDNAYSQLISKKLVIPGSSSSSTLYIKLNSDNPNNVMPPSGKIAQVLIDSVAAWINKGAPND